MQKEMNTLLTKAKELLRDEVSQIAYETWIKNIEICIMNGHNITLKVENDFQKDFILSKYIDLIQNTFNFLTNKTCIINIITLEEENKLEQTSSDNTEPVFSACALNPRYTFETFVIGNNNSLAHAGAVAVSEAPSSSYNPLFLYGGVGLGKTHLMHAIGNEILKNNRSSKILYVTSETFTNEYVNAIKTNSNEAFRKKYRSIDLLLIDDIQFIAGKERVQEEFFHTYNALHEKGSLLVISSDKPPKEIHPLEERLKSRFEWGLLADVNPPDYETRLAILRKKCELEHILIDDKILSEVAMTIDSNIRELEGVLNKMIIYSSLMNCPINEDVMKKTIHDISIAKETNLSIEHIQDVVSKFFNINPLDLKSSKRTSNINFPRQIAMYFCRELLNTPLQKIGQAFNKDHTTVMHSYKKIEKEINDDYNIKLLVENVKNILINKTV